MHVGIGGSTGPVGIDLGWNGIRLIQLRRGGSGLRLVGRAELTGDQARLLDVDPDVAGRRIRAAKRSGGLRGRACSVALPRGVVNVQSLRMPVMSDDELREAVAFEAADRMGVERAELECDVIRTGVTPGEGREEVMMVAALRSDLDPWLERLAAAGLRPIGLEPGFTALGRWCGRRLRRAVDADDARLVCEVGGSGATVMLLQGGRPVLVKALPVGGDAFDEAVRERLSVSPEAASEIRAARLVDPLARGSEVDRAVFEAVRPRMAELVRETVLCLRYAGVTFRGVPPSRVVLTGEHAREPRLRELLSEACDLPVELDLGDPADGDLVAKLVGANGERCDDAAARLSRWAVAAGVALRGLVVPAGIEHPAAPADVRPDRGEARRSAA